MEGVYLDCPSLLRLVVKGCPRLTAETVVGTVGETCRVDADVDVDADADADAAMSTASDVDVVAAEEKTEKKKRGPGARLVRVARRRFDVGRAVGAGGGGAGKGFHVGYPNLLSGQEGGSLAMPGMGVHDQVEAARGSCLLDGGLMGLMRRGEIGGGDPTTEDARLLTPEALRRKRTRRGLLLSPMRSPHF